MKKILRTTLVLAAILGATVAGTAAWSKKLDATSKEQMVRDAVLRFDPKAHVDSVSKAPFKGFYQAIIGAQVLYVSEDGSHLIEGDAVEVATQRNVTNPVIERQIATMLHSIADTGLRYAPTTKQQGTVYVFTDPGCGYCRKLHSDMKDLQSKGVEVVYLAFPRAGLQSREAAQLSGVFCSKDKAGEMDKAIAGGVPADAGCKSPVADHYTLGQKLSITGTPAVYTADGRQIGGYLSPDEIVTALSNAPGLRR